ncbi:MAG: TauD/TfdA family dioxygenase [Pseudomonadales bacterium]|jgi:taurine dioxygenase|nr:TauD/TfdA family dioxygenase [Pseudomonadales bacterium]MDP4910627.1 TauD/TfdA family dioxygenase [Pseudomonadales bacterium]
MLELTPVAGALGAEVKGIDLCGPLDSNTFKALNDALLNYEVLFFRDQPMSPAQHAALANLFGKPQLHEAYPHVSGYPQLTILENDEANPSKIEKWHTDMTFRAHPPLGSILHCQIMPARGGDTLFASMSAAYAGLSSKMQDFLSSLTAIHDFSYGFKESLEAPGGRERLAQMVLDNPPQEHPVVRTHPESGKKGLFVNCLFTSAIKGMKEGESRALLNFLFSHMESPEYSCRMHWQADSVAFWDNRITQHRPINDYWPQHRKMQRITIDGDRPV